MHDEPTTLGGDPEWKPGIDLMLAKQMEGRSARRRRRLARVALFVAPWALIAAIWIAAWGGLSK